MILHHWDTDGICSAAIYMNIRGEDKLFTPKIGNFYLDEEDFKIAISNSNLVILDMNIPEAEKLCSHVKLRIYDHHRTKKVECAEEHYNPFIWGIFYPSCTTVLMERFSYLPDYLVALGILGDKGPKARDIKEWEIVEKVMKKGNLKFDDMMMAVNLLDSSFKLNKRDEVVENVYLVRESINSVLSSDKLQGNIEKIEREVEKWVVKAEDMGKYFFLHMRTPYQLISTVTRELAWKNNKVAIVINEKSDRDEFYIRSPEKDFDALPIIELARERGYRAGGKREVMGAILPRGEGEKFVKMVLEMLKW